MRVLIATRFRETWQLAPLEDAEKSLKSWHELRNKWASLGKVVGTFFGPGNGLPAPGQEDWFALKIFEVPDIDTVKKMSMAYFFSEVRKYADCRFIVGTEDDLEKEWLDKQQN